MLEVKLNGEKGDIYLEVEGNLSELLSDVTILLQCMYKGIREEEKKEFVKCIKIMAENELFTKSSKEIGEETEKIKNKIMKKIVNDEELLDLLKDIFK